MVKGSLVRSHRNMLKHFTTREGLASDQIRTLLDDGHALWIGTTGVERQIREWLVRELYPKGRTGAESLYCFRMMKERVVCYT
jgi:hypothetical protein